MSLPLKGRLKPGPRFDPKRKIAIAYCLFDIDNTLVGNNASGLPTARFIEAAQKANQLVAMGVSSARPLTKAGHIIDACQMRGYSLLSNGAQIFNGQQKKMAVEYVVPPEPTKEIVRTLQRHRISHWVQDDGIDHFWSGKVETGRTLTGGYQLGTYERAQDIWQPPEAGNRLKIPGYAPRKPFVIVAHDVSEEQKLMLLQTGESYEQAHIAALVGHEKVLADGTKVYDVFFVDKRANKKDALKLITDMSGVPVDSTMAVGDGPNDAVIVEYAGIGVAMGNSVDATLRVATFMAPSQADDGASVAMETLVLDREWVGRG